MFKYSYDALVYFGEDVEKSIPRVAKFGYDAIDLAQAIDVATEYRALRGRTSSADAALQTAGTAGLRPVLIGASPKRKIPRGRGRGRVTRFLR
jgi:hypothetical protein